MPVRSLNSSVLKWPDKTTVDAAVRRWSEQVVAHEPGVRRIGYFGSYARGDWGVGSDLDLVIVVTDSSLPFEERSRGWDTSDLPVPTDVLIYTTTEWNLLPKQEHFFETVSREAIWVYTRGL